MIHILTSTTTILKVGVRPQESRIGDSNVKAVLSLKLKQTLTDESFIEQQGYLQSSATAAYVSLNKLDQHSRFRANVNLFACNNKAFNFTQGSSSSGLGFALACFDAWWRLNLNKKSNFKYPIFATGEILTSGQINPIAHITEKIESVCNYVEKNKDTISSFYLCYPISNDEEIPASLKERLFKLNGQLIASNRLQETLGELLGKYYDGDPLGRWTPFKGLNSFDYEDSVRFFGRDKDIERIYNNIKNNSGLLIVSGVSGSGKSSLIKAGLIPKLEKEYGSLFWSSCTPNTLNPTQEILHFIFEQLIQAWNIPCQNVNEIIDIFNTSKDDGIVFLQKFLANESINCLLYLDQYEEIFKQGVKTIDIIANELSVIDLLAKSLTPLNIVLAVRNEYLGHLLDGQALGSPIILNVAPQLNSQEWQSIVREQALFSGITFEQGENNKQSLDELIIEEATQTPFSLPMVSFLLEQLYIKALEESSTMLLYKHYEHLGGLRGVITYRASQLIQENTTSEKQLLQLFDFFVGITSEGSPLAKKVLQTQLEQTDKEFYDLVNKFIDASLIVNIESEIIGFKLADKNLINDWDLLNNWFLENRNYLLWKNIIEPKFEKWKSYKNIDLNRPINGKAPLELIMEGIDDREWISNKSESELTDLTLLLDGRKYVNKGIVFDSSLKEYINTANKNVLNHIFVSTVFIFIFIYIFV